jgi:hypothetical protein
MDFGIVGHTANIKRKRWVNRSHGFWVYKYIKEAMGKQISWILVF